MIGIAITPKFIILIGCLLSLVFYLFLLTPLSIILGIKFTSHIVTYKKSLLHGLCISILIELLQYVELIISPTISRSVDITDVILNSIGFVIGHFIYKTLFKKTKNVVK